MARHFVRAWGVWVLFLALAFGGLARDPISARAQESSPAGNEETTAKDKAQEDEEYLELLRLFADTLDQVDRNYVKEVSRRELMEAAIKGVLSKLDPYSNYIPPKELEQFTRGVENEFGGIGIQVSIEEGKLTIISPIVGAPAYRAGLRAGDTIVRIGEESTKGITLDDAVNKLKGKEGTTVTFTVQHATDNSTETVTLRREIIQLDTVLGDRRNGDDSWNFMYDSDKKIAYIRITAFSRNTTRDLKKALEDLTAVGMRGLVLDLRFNPGGLLTSAVEISDLFVSEGKIVSTKGRNAPEQPRMAHKAGTFEGFPIAILVNRGSASASEIVSACLQDHGRAAIIGERTWGKGSVQNLIQLEDGKSVLKLTTASYHRPSGKNIHRFEGAKDSDEWGVLPDVGYEVKLSDAETAQFLSERRERDIVGRRPGESSATESREESKTPFVDRQLEKALAYLSEKLGDKPAVVEDPKQKMDTTESVSSAKPKPQRKDGDKTPRPDEPMPKQDGKAPSAE